MTSKNAKPHIKRHKDGSIWARGHMLDGVPTGYWIWFRKDGTRMRSGTFENGQQVGKWTTYDRESRPWNVTVFRRSESRTGCAAPFAGIA